MIDDGTCYACPLAKWHDGPCEKSPPLTFQDGLDSAAIYMERLITEQEANKSYTSRAMRMIFLDHASKIRAITGRLRAD